MIVTLTCLICSGMPSSDVGIASAPVGSLVIVSGRCRRVDFDLRADDHAIAGVLARGVRAVALQVERARPSPGPRT